MTAAAESLPVEIFHRIFSHLNGEDLVNCSYVSRQWHDYTYDIRLWRRLIANEVAVNGAWLDLDDIYCLFNILAFDPSGTDEDQVNNQVVSLIANIFERRTRAQRRASKALTTLCENNGFLQLRQLPQLRCCFLGPGIELNSGVFRKLMEHVSMPKTLAPRQRYASFKTAGFSQQGFELLLPLGTDSTATKAGQIQIGFTFMNARPEMERKMLPFGGSRLHGSRLTTQTTETNMFEFLPTVRQILTELNFVVYVVDCSMLNAESQATVSLAEETEVHFREVQSELTALRMMFSHDNSEIRSLQQCLVVLVLTPPPVYPTQSNMTQSELSVRLACCKALGISPDDPGTPHAPWFPWRLWFTQKSQNDCLFDMLTDIYVELVGCKLMQEN